MKQFIIGRQGNQPFVIPDSCYHVSGEHAQLTVTDEREWWIEDLNSTNGTFVQDEVSGEYTRIGKKRIDEYTRISLGGTKIGCFTFMAHHVLESYSHVAQEDAENYGSEFQHVIEVYNLISDEKDALEQSLNKKARVKMIPAIMIPLIGLPLFFLGQNDVRIAITYVIAQIGSLIPLIIDRFSSEKARLAILKQRQRKVCVCPHCNLPLTEADIQRQCCPRCRAHA